MKKKHTSPDQENRKPIYVIHRCVNLEVYCTAADGDVYEVALEIKANFHQNQTQMPAPQVVRYLH